ncbi:MAG TPA: macro domain-containing protein [candidate division Zixibacteria bacterium]|nr:macro domain-containing protein [candidate division Zixibacteria bacterium]
MIIQLLQGDITDLQVDVIVNAANNELWMGAGVAGAIKRKGGIEIEKEAMSKGPIKHGEAIETKAGKLKAKYVIHAAGMRSDGYITEESLKNSIINSLKLAEKLQLTSIAFPAIGTGVAGFDIVKCAKIMYETIKNFNYSSLKVVNLVLYNENSFLVFLKEIGQEKIEL